MIDIVAEIGFHIDDGLELCGAFQPRCVHAGLADEYCGFRQILFDPFIRHGTVLMGNDAAQAFKRLARLRINENDRVGHDWLSENALSAREATSQILNIQRYCPTNYFALPWLSWHHLES